MSVASIAAHRNPVNAIRRSRTPVSRGQRLDRRRFCIVIMNAWQSFMFDSPIRNKYCNIVSRKSCSTTW